eukprot:180473-Pyramimonas_sp.AAC.2
MSSSCFNRTYLNDLYPTSFILFINTSSLRSYTLPSLLKHYMTDHVFWLLASNLWYGSRTDVYPVGAAAA